MSKKNTVRRLFINGVLATFLSFNIICGGVSAVMAYAGPADDPASAAPVVGPNGPAGGSSDGTSGTADSQADGSYYNLSIVNQIVNPVDKYSYDQMVADITSLSNRYPGQITVRSIGQSADGRDIYDVIVGNPNASKKILFQGAIHAREYIVVPLIMQQIEYLAAGFANNGTYMTQPLSATLGQVAFHFVPMLNPDGVTISQMGESGIRSEELRKIMQDAYAQDVASNRTAVSYEEYMRRWKANARGVDLNYNFAANWDGINVSLTHPSANGYKGTNPLSESETQAIATLIQGTGFNAVINYHAMGNVIYWDTQNNLKATESKEMANAVNALNGYSVLGSKGVGGLKDWLQQTAGIAGITIEVGRSTCPVSFSEYPAIWEQNKAVPATLGYYVATH